MQELSRIPPSDTVNAFLSSDEQPGAPTHSYPPFSWERFPGNGKIAEHLANERTFLAWIRTALAVISFGVALGRWKEPVRGGHTSHTFLLPYAPLLVGGLTLVGMSCMIVSLIHFLHLRYEIEQEQFCAGKGYALWLTVLSCLMAGILALFLSAN